MSVVVLVLAALVVGVAFTQLNRLPRRPPHRPAPDGDGPFLFPAGFLWGAATADQQIEHQQPSDWTDFENRARTEGLDSVHPTGRPVPGHIKGIRAVPAAVLQRKADFDRVFADDLRRAASMGHNAHRFSMSWARLFPREDMDAPDPAGIDFYGRVLDECQRAGLVPFVTLHHFANPRWLAVERDGQRGVERSDAVPHFERYASAVARAFGDRVRFWCTLNEPMVYAFQGYLDGTFPPNERRAGPPAVTSVVTALLQMHAAAYRAIHEDAKRRHAMPSVGIAQHVRAFMPWRDGAPLDRFTAMMVERAFVLDFLDAIHTGTLQTAQAGVVRDIPGLKGSMDYVGVNFYGRAYLKTKLTDPTHFDVVFADASEPGEDISDVGWAADEEAFTTTLTRFHTRWRRPLYVLENGIADAAIDDVRRQQFLVRHAQAMWRAVQHGGADVRGYFHWSLIDNFEWAEGFGPRFGLYAVDYENDFVRSPRASVDVFRQIASQNAVPSDLWRRLRR